jgi:hypothetical protein
MSIKILRFTQDDSLNTTIKAHVNNLFILSVYRVYNVIASASEAIQKSLECLAKHGNAISDKIGSGGNNITENKLFCF